MRACNVVSVFVNWVGFGSRFSKRWSLRKTTDEILLFSPSPPNLY